MAIGASARQLAFAVGGDAYRVIVVGMLLGVPVALMTSQWLGTLLFKVRPFDAVTLIGTAGASSAWLRLLLQL